MREKIEIIDIREKREEERRRGEWKIGRIYHLSIFLLILFGNNTLR